MPISHKHKIILIHIPKNAGTSIANSLEMTDMGHHKPHYYKNKYPREWESYNKIAIIRNTWDRFVSSYEYARMEESYWHSVTGKARYSKHPDLDLLKKIEFNKCVTIFKEQPELFKHQGWHSQCSYIFDENNNLMVDILINYKNLEDKIYELTGVKIKKQNSSGHKDYKLYYDSDSIEKISEIYKRDIKLLGFTYED
jgi:hypothetical protein